jgi:DNA-binding transcriptional MerR regulator
MARGRIISISEVCRHYQLETNFLQSLNEMGLIALIEEANQQFVEEEQLPQLEVILHLHYDLSINLEGIDAIGHLLNRLQETQRELSRLRGYQGDF